jgi:hypothetical protein
MSGVDWESAPDDAVFYAQNFFRNNRGDYWEENYAEWREGSWYMPELITSEDYEKRPTIQATQWTAQHYDNYYHLSEKDIKDGKIKVDAYFVNKMWKLNQKDDTGGLFHSLKTIARFGEKNPIERELKALYNQTKRMAELYGVELE